MRRWPLARIGLGFRTPGMALVLLTACTAQGQAPDESPAWIRWWKRNLVDRIELNGYRQLGFHSHTVDGDREAFNSLNYFGLGRQKFTDIGQINFAGRNVLGLFNFQGTILDSRLSDPQGQRFSLDFERDGWSVNAGDIQGRLLNSNRFASFQKSLNGLQVGYKSGRLEARTVVSEVRGSPRTVTIQGNNSSGPYYIQNSQLVQGSERVSIDGQPQSIGEDYVINYEAGSITFVGKTVPVTSTILVSYEAFGFNETRGSLYGAGLALDGGKVGKIGLTMMRQEARSGGGASSRLEKFQGFGAPSTPYFLQFEPINLASVTIRVNGVLQVRGVDYTFDQFNSAVFYFNRFMPASDNIDVVYTPKPRATVDGDREVMGIDYALPIGTGGRDGQLRLHQAMGKLKGVTPQSGVARGAELDYRKGAWSFRTQAVSIPRGYVAIETTGFNRNEKAFSQSATYEIGRGVQVQLDHENRSIANRSITATLAPVRFVSQRLTIDRASEGTGGWRLSHNRSRTLQGVAQTRLDSTDLVTTQRSGPRLLYKLGLNRQQAVSRNLNGQRTDVDLLGLQLGGAYTAQWRKRPTKEGEEGEIRTFLTLGADVNLVEIESKGRRGQGRDYELSANLIPDDRLQVDARYTLSDSGSIATLDQFATGWQAGFDGNGFSGGSGSTGTIGATNAVLWSLNAAYRFAENLSAYVGYRSLRSTGSVSSNSETRGWSAGATWAVNSRNQVTASLEESSTTFVDSPLRSGVWALNLFLEGSPTDRLRYVVGWSAFDSRGNSTFQQDSNNVNGSLSYLLGQRDSVVLSWNSSVSTGYLPQNSLDWGLTYQYRIWSNLALNASYRLRNVDNRDPLINSGAYRSRGFDLELSFNFFR